MYAYLPQGYVRLSLYHPAMTAVVIEIASLICPNLGI